VPEGADVRQAAGECTSFLAASVDADWAVGVPDLEMTVAEVVAHAAEVCLWYAVDLAAAEKDVAPVEQRVKPDAAPDGLVATLATHAAVVAAVVDASPPTARGFHPLGAADPSGFAAMACDEVLVHTDDAGRGLDRTFSPPVALAEAVLRRLFPWVAVDGDPWLLLRWANGRTALPDRPRLTRWRWHCAPLDDWDGRPPDLARSPGA
jgi:Mycothiol maleylpyruvate isomerase N-terminal domain